MQLSVLSPKMLFEVFIGKILSFVCPSDDSFAILTKL